MTKRTGPSRTVHVLLAVSLALAALTGPVVSATAAPPPASPSATTAGPTSATVGADRGVARPSAAQLTDRRDALRQKLDAAGAGGAKVRLRDEDGTAGFVSADRGRSIRASAAARRAAATNLRGKQARPGEQVAREFLTGFGSAFAIEDQSDQLETVSAVPGVDGSVAVKFRQTQDDVPVLGGELVVTVDDEGALSASGQVSPSLDTVATTPRVSADEAAAKAVAETARTHKTTAAGLTAATPQRWIFDPALMQAPGPQGRRLVWRTEVTSDDGLVRRLVLVDAALGKIALAFDENPQARARYVCDAAKTTRETCRTPFARREGGAAVALADVNLAYDFTGITYDYFRRLFGRDSIDGRGMPLVSTVRYREYSSSAFDNAYWNGTQMVFGEGYASADDVVGHEMTHGITERTANLFYYQQSGAINEAVSDIFGELIDQVDGRGTDSSGYRWLMGEDLPDGAIRDMRTPGRGGQPDRVGGTYWYTDVLDNGGVHINSGVANKAAFLLVDGGIFNGQTVGAIGADRTARIFYEALTRLMTSATDYRALADILPQACLNLVGTGNITSSICTAVQRAVTATQMANTAPGNPAAAPVCGTGESRQDLFADDLEASSNWEKATVSGFGWAYPQTDNAYDLDLSYASSGRKSMWGDDPSSASDGTIRMKTPVTLPASGTAYLRFAHAWSFYPGDGGQLVYSTNNGATWTDASGLTTVNGMTSTATALGDGPAWDGMSRGYTSSRVDLTSLAGQSVRFGFRVASTSLSDGGYGWFVDDVAIYTCASSLPAAPSSVSVDDVRVTEGPSASLEFTLTRTSSAGAASVAVATTNGSAVAGADYTPVSTTVNFADGEATKTVTVAVTDDDIAEFPETVNLMLGTATGMLVGDPAGVGLIIDDKVAQPTTIGVIDTWPVEGNSGAVNAAFVLTRSGDLSGTSTVTVWTIPSTATSADFVPLAPTVVTFTPGMSARMVQVPLRPDRVREGNEVFVLGLRSPTGAVLADNAARATIIDDDSRLVVPARRTFLISDIAVEEPDAGTRVAYFTISRQGDVSSASSVVVSTANVTATAGTDYVAIPPTRITLAAGVRSRTLGVTVRGDTIPEFQERLRVNLSSPVNALVGDPSGDAVLVDRDAGEVSRLSLTDVSIVERHPGIATATVTVTRTGPTDAAVSAPWSTVAGALLPRATAGLDYRAASGTVTVPAGATSATFRVLVPGQKVFEPVEHVGVALWPTLAAPLGDPTADVKIIDND